jgi:hypothetical protein
MENTLVFKVSKSKPLVAAKKGESFVRPVRNLGFATRLFTSLVTSALVSLAPTAFAAHSVPNPTVTPIPYDAGSKHHPFIASTLDLSSYGYTENEFEFSGTANTYKKQGRWKSDGQWDIAVKQAGVPYATRLLVRRPIDPAKFNGIVVVEWLNVTALIDVDVIWAQSHTELLREGYAWVGVSVQKAGVNVLKNWDPDRYGSLEQSDDGLSYDIFSQAAQAVRSQSSLVLGGLPIKAVMGAGESQSAMRLNTYVNAFQASASQVYDGLLAYSRFGFAAPLGNGIGVPAPLVAHIRADNAVKLLQMETEQDVAEFLYRLARQDDTDHLRTWELAGASHYDAYGVANLLPQYERDVPKLGSNIQLDCKNNLNEIPEHYVVNAALSALSKWMTTGQAPPHSPQIDFKRSKVVRDAYGNAEGGIRLPEMDAATATNNFDNRGAGGFINAFACPFLGNTVPFDTATLTTLYPTHQDYVSKFTSSAVAALNAGFMLQADYDEAVAQAQASPIP